MKKLSLFKFISCVIALTLGSSLALADVRVQKLCQKPTGADRQYPACFGDPEFTEFCRVGVRGDWLDTTNRVVYVSGPRVTPTIERKGVDRQLAPFGAEVCDPGANKDREGFVELQLRDIEGSGTLRLKLERPGGSDIISIPIKDGSMRIRPSLTSSPIKVVLAQNQPNQTVRFTIQGRGLDRLRVKSQANIDAEFRNAGRLTGSTFRIVETHADVVRPPAKSETATIEVQIRGFDNRPASARLTSIVEFPQGISEFNAIFQPPLVHFGLAEAPVHNSGSVSSSSNAPPLILINQGAPNCRRNAQGGCI